MKQCTKQLITTIIPTYNRADKIIRALRSVLTQTHRPIEVVVVDDHSEDGTREVVETFIRKYGLQDLVIYVRNTRNLGLAGARNVGVKMARGEYIAFLDDDDYFFPHKLERQLNVLLINKGKVCSCGMINVEKINGERILRSPVVMRNGRVSFENGAAAVSWLLHRSVFEKIGYFDERFPSAEDAEFLVRLNQQFKIYFAEEYLFLHYYYEDHMTAVNDIYIQGFELLLKKHKEKFNRYELGSLYLKLAVLHLVGNQKNITYIARSVYHQPNFKNLLFLVVSLFPTPMARAFTNKLLNFLNYSRSFAGRNKR